MSAMPDAKATALRLHRDLDRDEAISVAYLTLVQVAPRFDPSLGFKFWSFAWPYVIGALKDKLREAGGLTAARGKPTPEYIEVTDRLAACRLRQSDFRVLRRAVASLDAKSRRIARAVATSEGRGAGAHGLLTDYAKLGMKEATYHLYRRRVLAQLRRELQSRGVRKVSDIL